MTKLKIEKNGEDMLYAKLLAHEHEKKSGSTPDTLFLLCRYFHTDTVLDIDQINDLFGDICANDHCAIYTFKDGDIVFEFNSPNGNDALKSGIIEIIRQKFGDQIKSVMPLSEFFIEYSFFDNIEKLKFECFKKQGKTTRSAKKLSEHMQNDRLINTFRNTLQLISMQRTMRSTPHILIVEDQAFSQKMLLSILKDYTCSVASNTSEAMLMYMEKCPDIVLLDIELPDLSGHSFARLLNNIDPDAYIVMVTGNKYESDVKAARDNNAKGFIPKPYKKDAILSAINKFHTRKKRKAS